jgi:uncharacterized protein (TIGR02301 family)
MVRSGPGAGSRNRKCAIIGAAALGLLAACPSVAQEARGYDDKLLRLSEILGAVHYLRELCGADEGQLWRDRMRDLIDAEGSSALRRARLTRSFNKGYQGYSRTYRTCTSSAQTAINRFLGEATQLADGLIRDVP